MKSRRRAVFTGVRRKRVIVRVEAGPTWESGPVDEQPGWDEHADFIDGYVERGLMVMGGPFADSSGSVSIWEGRPADEIRAIQEQDPFVANGVFRIVDVRDWIVFVDELTPNAAD